MALGLTAWFSLVPTGSLWLGLGTEHSPLLSPELLYEDVFAVWEVIWAARHISSEHFVLFIALALVEAYREIIRDNNMDFTDIIKFFNGTCRPGHLAVSSKAAGVSAPDPDGVGGVPSLGWDQQSIQCTAPLSPPPSPRAIPQSSVFPQNGLSVTTPRRFCVSPETSCTRCRCS